MLGLLLGLSTTHTRITGGVLGFLIWLTLPVFLCIRSLRRGHWVVFLIGPFVRLFWIIGALTRAHR